MKKDEEEEGKIKDRKRIYINPLEISPFSQLRTSTVEDASAKGGGGGGGGGGGTTSGQFAQGPTKSFEKVILA